MDTDQNEWRQEFIDNWLWLCPVLGVVVAAGVLIVFGLSFWTSAIAALLLVCPILIIWIIIQFRPSRKK